MTRRRAKLQKPCSQVHPGYIPTGLIATIVLRRAHSLELAISRGGPWPASFVKETTKLEGTAATATTLARRIADFVGPTITDLGFDTVRVEFLGLKSPRVQIMVERVDGSTVTLDDCARVSRAVSALLDVEDLIPGAYTLEVSSPGIDRPLVRLHDFERFAGFEAKVELARPLEGRRRYRGRLLGTESEMVRLDSPDGTVALPYVDIHRAKLVLTDELIRAFKGKT